MNLWRYVAQRLVAMSFVLLGVSLIVFFLAVVIPRDPVSMWIPAESGVPQSVVDALRQKYHLDEPYHIQFYYYLLRLLQGDLGLSAYSQRPVAHELMRRIPASFELGVYSLLLSLAIGVPAGIISATRRNKLFDHAARLFSLGGVCIPQFWLGLMLQYALFYYIPLIPEPGGRVSTSVILGHPLREITGFYVLDSLLTGNWPVLVSSIQHLILPAITLSSFTIAFIMRMTRASVLEVINRDYITTAKAYGFRERTILLKYALRNSLVIITTVTGISVGWLLSGSTVVETIFYWPGLGTFLTQSIYNSDFPAIIGWVLLNAFIFSIANLAVDLMNFRIDPRVSV